MHHVKTLIIFLAGLFLMTTGFSQSPREVQVIKLADNFVFPEGPVWHPGGYLLFSDVHDFKIIRVNPDGTNSVWLDKKIKTNGLILSNDKKKIYACGHSLLSPLEIDLKTREYKVLANQFEGKPFNNVNDVALDKKGNIFFTDPTWSKTTVAPQGVYCINRQGKLSLAVALEQQPNGIVVSPDQQYIYVDRSGASDIWRFKLHSDGTFSDGTCFVKLERGCQPDGMTIDSKGNLYVAQATNGKICIVSPEGKILQVIQVTERLATNCEFEGNNENILYVTCGGSEKERKGSIYKLIFSVKRD